MRLFTILAALWLTAAPLRTTQAQYTGRSGGAALLNSDRVRSLGLEKSWYAHARVNTSREALLELALHVRPQVIYQVTTPAGEKYEYSSLDVDPGSITPIGALEAKKRAEEKLASLNVIKGLWSSIETELPKELHAKLERLDKSNTLLVSVSERGNVDVFDGETGRRRWTRSVGESRYPTAGAGLNDHYVAVVNGVDLYLMEIASGDLIWRRKLDGVPGAPPALSEQMVFVPTVTGALESYRIDDPAEPRGRYQGAGRALVQPLTTPQTVVWPTDRSHYYVAPASETGIYYRLETAGQSLARPAYAKGKLFMVSLQGYVYCLEEIVGQLQWSRAFGEPFSQQPQVVAGRVYIVSDYHTMWCLDASTGETQWKVRGVDRVLGVSKDRVFVAATQMTRVQALDIQRGQLISEIALNGANIFPLTNSLTDRVYLADYSGLIQCFRPIGSTEPLVHVEVDEIEVQSQREPKPQDETPPADAARPPAADNPFGGGGENPFGGGGADGNPFGGDAGGGGNPFGGDAGGGGNPFGGGGGGGGGGENPFGGGGGDNPFGGGGMNNDNPFGGN